MVVTLASVAGAVPRERPATVSPQPLTEGLRTPVRGELNDLIRGVHVVGLADRCNAALDVLEKFDFKLDMGEVSSMRTLTASVTFDTTHLHISRDLAGHADSKKLRLSFSSRPSASNSYTLTAASPASKSDIETFVTKLEAMASFMNELTLPSASAH